MAICHEMNEGDVFFCKLCGLCCGQDMTKK